jgi:ribosomal protein L13E
LRVWREKNRIHVNEVERLRKQKKREEQNAKKIVSVIEPVVEPVIEAVKDNNSIETPLDIEQTIVTGMDKIAIDTMEKVGMPDQLIKNDDENKTPEKPKAKRGRKRVVVV